MACHWKSRSHAWGWDFCLWLLFFSWGQILGNPFCYDKNDEVPSSKLRCFISSHLHAYQAGIRVHIYEACMLRLYGVMKVLLDSQVPRGLASCWQVHPWSSSTPCTCIFIRIIITILSLYRAIPLFKMTCWVCFYCVYTSFSLMSDGRYPHLVIRAGILITV